MRQFRDFVGFGIVGLIAFVLWSLSVLFVFLQVYLIQLNCRVLFCFVITTISYLCAIITSLFLFDFPTDLFFISFFQSEYSVSHLCVSNSVSKNTWLCFFSCFKFHSFFFFIRFIPFKYKPEKGVCAKCHIMFHFVQMNGERWCKL